MGQVITPDTAKKPQVTTTLKLAAGGVSSF
jgi:hypothetical protein